MCIKPKRFKDLVIPKITLNGRSLKFITENKYLGCVISDDFKDDKDIARQMRYVYSMGNGVVRNFTHCTNDVKMRLFKAYCSNFYCCQLWSSHKLSSYNKLRVAYNNIFRSLFKLRRDTSISAYMVNSNMDSFQVIIRKQIYKFRERVFSSDNLLVATIVNAVYFTNNRMSSAWNDKLFDFVFTK